MSFETLDIVILNYRTAEMAIETARKSQAAAPGAALYVVDNGSGDGSFERLEAALPDATVIANEQNLGFGGGMNRGLRQGRRPFVVLQACDTYPVADAYGELLRRAQTDERLGAVTPLLLDHELRPVAHFRPEPSPWHLVMSLFPGVWRLQECYVEAPADKVNWLSSFAATLFRREAIVGGGSLDPAYFLGWEEWDLARRLRGKGWRIAHHPAAQVVHSGAATVPTSAMRIRRSVHGRSGLLHHLRKHHGQGWYLAGRVADAVTKTWLRVGGKSAPSQPTRNQAG